MTGRAGQAEQRSGKSATRRAAELTGRITLGVRFESSAPTMTGCVWSTVTGLDTASG
jgi:hypothetical protein